MATEYYLLTIEGSVDMNEMSTTHVMKSDNVTANDTLDNGEDLLQAWNDEMLGDWLVFQSNQYQVGRVTARRINPSGSAVATKQYQTGAAIGTIAQPCSALQTAPALRIIPSTFGSTAGRCFLPSPAITSIDNNSYAAAYQAAVSVYFDKAISGIANAFNWVLAVHHRKTNTFSTAVSYNLSAAFGFQGRRRKPVS